MSVWRRSYTIRLARPDGGILFAAVDCESREWTEGGFRRGTWSIHLTCDACELDGEGDDFFDAFCRVREGLTPYGLTPLCYGASRNVYPSGMARDMAQGLQASKLPVAGPVGIEHLVGIFDEGPDVEPASVAEQREFMEQWLRSRRR